MASSTGTKKSSEGGNECTNCCASEGREGVVLKSCSRCKLVRYCSISCQKQHWEAGRHKKFCIPAAERTLKQAATEDIPQAGGRQDECVVCLDPMTASTSCTLECMHTFHTACISALREHGVAQACPSCRAVLPPSKALDDATWLTNLSSILYDKGKFAKAEETARKAIAVKPETVFVHHAHYILGLLLIDKGDMVSAKESFRRTIALNPKDAEAHSNLGSLLINEGDILGAEVSYRAGLSVDPNNAILHCNLGGVLTKKGDLRGAEACFRKGIALNPNAADQTGARYELGHIIYAKGDLAGAEKCFREFLAVNPKNADAHCALGTVLHIKGDAKGAEAAFRACLANGPRDSIVHTNLGAILIAKAEALEARSGGSAAVAKILLEAAGHLALGPETDHRNVAALRAKAARLVEK